MTAADYACHYLTCARCEHPDVCMDDGGRTCEGCGVALHAECECLDCPTDVSVDYCAPGHCEAAS